MAEDASGRLWFGTYRGAVSIRFEDGNYTEPAEIKVYDTLKGLPSMNGCSVFWNGKQILVGTSEGLYAYNAEEDKLKPSDYLGEAFAKGQVGIRGIKKDENGNFWLNAVRNGKERLEIVRKNGQGKFEADTTALRRIKKICFV